MLLCQQGMLHFCDIQKTACRASEESTAGIRCWMQTVALSVGRLNVLSLCGVQHNLSLVCAWLKTHRASSGAGACIHRAVCAQINMAHLLQQSLAMCCLCAGPAYSCMMVACGWFHVHRWCHRANLHLKGCQCMLVRHTHAGDGKMTLNTLGTACTCTQAHGAVCSRRPCPCMP